jgi:hypothetical protein
LLFRIAVGGQAGGIRRRRFAFFFLGLENHRLGCFGPKGIETEGSEPGG